MYTQEFITAIELEISLEATLQSALWYGRWIVMFALRFKSQHGLVSFRIYVHITVIQTY